MELTSKFPKEIIKKFWSASSLGGLGIPSDADPFGISDYNKKQTEFLSDPTYIGFSFHFNMNPDLTDVNILPDTLFGDNKISDQNTITYLSRNGYAEEAKGLERFREGLLKIQKDRPWMITKIDGLDTVYKIDPKKARRGGDDSKITLSFTENLNMEITYLFDLYRKAIFDTKNMRFKVPDNMRMFGVTIFIYDIRTFQSFKKTKPVASTAAVSPTNTAAASKIPSDLSNTTTKIKSEEFKNLPILKLELSHCEFTILEDGIDITTLESSTTEQFSKTIGIKVGRVKEINIFNGFNVVTEDLIVKSADGYHKIESGQDVLDTAKGVTENTNSREESNWKGVLSSLSSELQIGNVYSEIFNKALSHGLSLFNFNIGYKDTETPKKADGNIGFIYNKKKNPEFIGNINFKENKSKSPLDENIGFSGPPSK